MKMSELVSPNVLNNERLINLSPDHQEHGALSIEHYEAFSLEGQGLHIQHDL